MICKISKIHLFFRSQSQFDYMLALFSGYSGHSSHQLINVHLTVGAISSHSCVCHHFSNIFHGIRPIIWRQRPRFSHRINMPYISDWGWSDSVTTFQIWINLFLSNKSEFTKFGIKYKTWEVLLGCNSLWIYWGCMVRFWQKNVFGLSWRAILKKFYKTFFVFMNKWWFVLRF